MSCHQYEIALREPDYVAIWKEARMKVRQEEVEFLRTAIPTVYTKPLPIGEKV